MVLGGSWSVLGKLRLQGKARLERYIVVKAGRVGIGLRVR